MESPQQSPQQQWERAPNSYSQPQQTFSLFCQQQQRNQTAKNNEFGSVGHRSNFPFPSPLSAHKKHNNSSQNPLEGGEQLINK